jgi:hypothetical protein
MICRIWHGRTAAANAPRYEAIVRGQSFRRSRRGAFPDSGQSI